MSEHKVNNTSKESVVTLIDRSKAIRNRCLIEFLLTFACRYALVMNVAVAVEVYIKGLCQIVSLLQA